MTVGFLCSMLQPYVSVKTYEYGGYSEVRAAERLTGDKRHIKDFRFLSTGQLSIVTEGVEE